ncbi:MAG: hypothetical protein HYU56_00910 [Candidatus Aenigmarchaeota archaeon]|nr:hypothetical protein [Candidatus Aenigmarchaeota archaeon]
MFAQRLATPKEWAEISIAEIDAKLRDGSRLSMPSYTLQIATSYPTSEDGELVSNVTQAQAAAFLREYNKANYSTFRYPMLYEDESVRDKLGKEHSIFGENFGRNGKTKRLGYVADFTKPYGKAVEGINHHEVVQRLIGWRLPKGDVEVGATTIAPTGMVPSFSRTQIEKRIGAQGLKRLEQLRGKEIYEKGDEIVDVRNALGYPQFTLNHDAKDESDLIPHSYHVYTPDQNIGETVGVRAADWYRHDGLRCFSVILYVEPGDSHQYRSFPLVRGGNLDVSVTRPSYKIRL